MLVTAGIVISRGMFVHIAPALFAGATIGFANSPKLGQYLVVTSVPSAVFACLLAALIIFALYRSRRNSGKSREDALPVWSCPACHEENPGNFQEYWKCQRIRQSQGNFLV